MALYSSADSNSLLYSSNMDSQDDKQKLLHSILDEGFNELLRSR
jgi:hypothetical protein